jgi:lysophospholipase L1-like esterase
VPLLAASSAPQTLMPEIPMFTRSSFILLAALLYALMSASLLAQPGGTADKPDKWEKEIASFEAQDAKSPPPKNAILFVGSSSIRLWNLKESFPDRRTINHGFGGSELADSVRFAKRIVVQHQPRVVVLYAGDNDIANGKSPQQIFADFQEFASVVHRALPKTKIIYIAIKPSIKRWALIDKIREANRLIREHVAEQKSDKLLFLDIEKPMLGADGKPRADLLQADGLHLNKQGYELWTRLLRPLISE